MLEVIDVETYQSIVGCSQYIPLMIYKELVDTVGRNQRVLFLIHIKRSHFFQLR